MMRQWYVVILVVALVSAAACEASASLVEPATESLFPHDRQLRDYNDDDIGDTVDLLEKITFCVETNGGATSFTYTTRGLFWHLYRFLESFANVKVYDPGFSCEALGKFTASEFENDAEPGEPKDGTIAPLEGEPQVVVWSQGDEVPTVEPNRQNIFRPDDYIIENNTHLGIWSWASYRPQRANKQVYAGLRGAPIIFYWSDLEPEQGGYDWALVDDLIDAAVTDSLYYSLEFLVGPMSPSWLYEQGVPKVITTEEGWVFPFYFDTRYLEAVDRFNQEVVNHLKQLPSSKAKLLSRVILNDGSTGDPYCYKGEPLDEAYAISREDWDAFRQDNLQSVHDYLGPDGLESIGLAFPHLSEESEALIYNLFPNVEFFKNGMASHGYHIPDDEASVIDVQRSQAFDGDAALGGNRVRWFGEMDREWLNEWFQQAPFESFWWSALYALHMGLSQWHIRDDALKIVGFHFAFDLFNKHAPYLDAATSPYAFCALREGLDASDTSKFRESKYGSASDDDPKSRVTKILDDHKDRGARVDDWSVVAQSAMAFRQRSGYVDVFYGGVRANYHKFLYQIDPDEESIGWWHVGGKDWAYGRFARSFEASSGKTAMYFRLDDRFISSKTGSHAVQVQITYFDEGDGEWELLYNDADQGSTSAVSVSCEDTPTWKRVQIDLTTALLNGGLQKGADFILNHTGGGDTKFHLVEVDRLDFEQ